MTSPSRHRARWLRSLTTSDSALAWFTAEHRVLLACITAPAAGRDRHVWQLAWTVKTYLYRGGYWHEQVATERAAADAARRDGDLRGRGQRCSAWPRRASG